MAETTVKKYLDLEGLQHLIEKLYSRGFKGMGLSKNDFTDALLAKLNSTATTEGMEEINTRLATLETLINADKDGTINKFNEIVAFLAGIADSSTLEGILSAKANKSDVYTKSEAEGTFVTPAQQSEALAPYAKTEAVNTGLAKKLDITDYNKGIEAKADKATTLAGYGITDAKIANGVITLGGASITPLTQHQSLSDYAKTADVNASLADKVNAADIVALTNTEIDAIINA
ncbi:MAG: hypothetical protein NC204_05765 [Candidatus Amulumruptor caecigallinarius]|nr:hypothetical protein [Candidatus Amulumruptor caecigallinarius]